MPTHLDDRDSVVLMMQIRDMAIEVIPASPESVPQRVPDASAREEKPAGVHFGREWFPRFWSAHAPERRSGIRLIPQR